MQFSPPAKQREWVDFVPSLSSAVVALVSIYFVHRLTKTREREKSVFDLHKRITDVVDDMGSAAKEGWTVRSKEKRETAVAKTLGKLQQIGGMVTQLKKLSRRSAGIRSIMEIDLVADMAALRDAITLGDFESTVRNEKPSEKRPVDAATSRFLQSLDDKFFAWLP